MDKKSSVNETSLKYFERQSKTCFEKGFGSRRPWSLKLYGRTCRLSIQNGCDSDRCCWNNESEYRTILTGRRWAYLKYEENI